MNYRFGLLGFFILAIVIPKGYTQEIPVIENESDSVELSVDDLSLAEIDTLGMSPAVEDSVELDPELDGGYMMEITPLPTTRGLASEQEVEVTDYHVVRRGQTLYRIGRIYDVTVRDIMSLNRMRNTVIYVGQKLLIRRRRVKQVASAPSSSSYGAPAVNQSPAPAKQNSYHVPRQSYDPGPNHPLLNHVNNAMTEWKDNRLSLRAIQIGISDYVDPNVPDLRFARNDAVALDKVWRMQRGTLYNDVVCNLLLGRQSTTQKIRYAVESLAVTAGAQDLLVISISGHAIVEQGELRILPSNYKHVTGNKEYITVKDLLHYIRSTRAKVLLILDVCYSEQAGYDFVKGMPRNMEVSVLVSSRKTEKSAEHQEWGHGAFTRAILEGAYGYADINRDALITLTELLLYTQARVRSMTNGYQHANLPINFLGDIPLFKQAPK